MFPANCERCNMHVKCCICSFYVKEGWTKSSSGFPKVTPNITTDWTSKYGGDGGVKKRNRQTPILEEQDKTAVVKSAHCSCKAGSGGHCNHILALLFQIVDYACLNVIDIPAELTCTSRQQTWHIPVNPLSGQNL